MFIGKSFSWEVVSKDLAYKTVDKSVYMHFGTGVPMDLALFFNNNLAKGEKKTIKIKFNGQIYDAFLMADQLENSRTRIMWNHDLGEEINKVLKDNLRKNNLDKNLKLAFRRLDLDYYEVKIVKVGEKKEEKNHLTKDLKVDIQVVEKDNLLEERRICEYVQLASYYNNDKVQCKILNKFIDEAKYLDADKNKIDLDSLRSIYTRDREDFFKLIEELKIRGFNFISNKKSRFFYIEDELKDVRESKFIYLEEDRGKYKLINKSIFNNFRYKDITSDFYFNFIPIKRLRVLYPDYSESFIENTFLDYGFKLFSYGEIKKIKVGDVKVADKEGGYKFLSKNEKILKQISIDKVLEDRYVSHLKIKEYLLEQNIDNILDFKNMDMEKLNYLEGVGVKTISDLKLSLNDLEQDIKENSQVYIKKIKSDGKEKKDKDDEILNMMLGKIKVSNIIPDNYRAYKNIGKKLEDDNIYNLNDLLNYDMSKLKKIKGVGAKRFDEFQDIINMKVDEVEKLRENLEYEKFSISLGDKEIEDISIYDLALKLNMSLDDKVLEYREMKLEDFIGKRFKEIGKDYNIELAISLKNFCDMVGKLKDINSIINSAILDLKENNSRDLEVLVYRNIDKMTLEEVGQTLGLTRERIRQIESKSLENFNDSLENYFFYDSLNLIYLKDNKYVDYCKLEKDVESHLLLELIKSNKIRNIYYLEEVNRLYSEDKDKDIKLITKQFEHLDNYGDRSEVKEIIQYINLEFGQFDELELREMFKKMNFNLKESYYFKNNINKMEQLEILFYLFYKDGYRIDDDTYKAINEKVYSFFGGEMDKTSGTRSLNGIADRSDKLILIGPRTYMHKAHIPINKKVLDSIYSILEKELEDHKLITAERLYDLYKEENYGGPLENYILSSHHIYFTVQDYFSDEFDFGHGNTMRILKKGVENKTNDQMIYDICKQHDGLIKISDLMAMLNWEEYKIDSAINNNKKLLSLKGKCIIVSYFFDDYVIEKIKSVTEKNLENGYTSSKMILEDIIFDRKVLDVLNKLNLSESKDITGLIKYLCPDLEGHTLFLYRKDSKIKSIDDLVEYKYPKEFYREELEDFLLKYGYAQGTIGTKLDELGKKGYVQLEETRYINTNYISLSDTIDNNKMNTLLDFVEECIDMDGFFIANKHINKISLIVGRTGYSLNQYLIAALLEEEGFIRLKRYNISYLNEIIVMVGRNSKYRFIHELVYDLLKYKYNGMMQEKNVYEYLSELGIYEKTELDSNKKLLGDIKYKNLIEVNLVGHVILK